VILAVLTWLGLSLCGLAAWQVILPARDMAADDLELRQVDEDAEGRSGDAAGRA
jgi:hypothetical protein